MSSRPSLIALTVVGLCLWSFDSHAQIPKSSIPKSGSAVPGTGQGLPTRPASNSVPRTSREPAVDSQTARPPAENAGTSRSKSGPLTQGDAQAQVDMRRAVTPEVWKLLQEWESKTKGITTLACEVKRFEYDKVFSTETRSLGKVQFEQPDHGRLEFSPADKTWLAKPGRVTPDNQPYKIIPGAATTWICTGTNVFALQHKAKTYDLIDIPPAMQGQNITRSPLPFIFGMKANDAIERYAIRIGSMNNPNGTLKSANGRPYPRAIHVIANPFHPDIAKEFVQAEFLMNPDTFLPLNLRMLDPSGNKETVYSFDHSTMLVNDGFGLLAGNPFKKPNLVGWQLMNHVKDQPEAPPASLRKAESSQPTQR